MRDIRFRAKRKDTGEWISGSTLARFDTDSGSLYFMPRSQSKCWASADDNGNITDMECTFFHVDQETVEQFIGTQDAYGEDIFENDIVKHNDKLYVIRYLSHLARFIGKSNNSIFSVFSFKHSIIVGNIHDNPEMMEAQDGSKH